MSARDFWSRRRASVEAEAKAELRFEQEQQAVAREAELAERSDEELLADLDLPAPESLKHGDDFRVFLTDQIPARIKTRALRHLWRANPVLACVDGLVDYGEDFRDSATVIENLQTAYQVGKGMTQHVDELARQAELDAQAVTGRSDTTQEAVSEVVVNADHQPNHDTGSAPAFSADTERTTEQITGQITGQIAGQPIGSEPRPQQGTEQDTPTDLASPAPSRRMRFSFENAQSRA